MQSSRRFQASNRDEPCGRLTGAAGIELPEHRNPEQGGAEGSLKGKFRVTASEDAPAENQPIKLRHPEPVRRPPSS